MVIGTFILGNKSLIDLQNTIPTLWSLLLAPPLTY
jgi:hypothetical protein